MVAMFSLLEVDDVLFSCCCKFWAAALSKLSEFIDLSIGVCCGPKCGDCEGVCSGVSLGDIMNAGLVGACSMICETSV